tara:strand:+ start:199714 stop:201063 length:1350 start_codon:yes stop_codon:yes gene_type:complete
VASEEHIRKIRWLLIVLIVGAAAILRFAYNANTLIVDPIRADAAYNLIYANNLLENSTFSKDRSDHPVPDSYWAPGYPLFLAAVIWTSKLLSVDTYHAILFCQLLLGAGTVLLCFMVAASFLPGLWPLLPALLAALSPHLVSTASYVLTETLFGFLLILAFYGLVRALRGVSHSSWFWAGTYFALSYLVNPVSLFLAPIIAIAIFLCARSGHLELPVSGVYRCLALFLAPLILTSALWSIRSAVSVPAEQATASKRLLTNLVIGMYPDYHEKWRASILQPEDQVVVPGSGVDKSYSIFFRALVQRFTQNPAQMLAWYAIQKPILLWDWDIRTGFGDIYIYRVEYSLYHTSSPAIATYSIMVALHPVVLITSVIGLGFIYRRGSKNPLMPILLYIALLYISLVYVLSQSEPRYSIPLRSEVYICFTFALWQVSRWLGLRARPQQEKKIEN